MFIKNFTLGKKSYKKLLALLINSHVVYINLIPWYQELTWKPHPTFTQTVIGWSNTRTADLTLTGVRRSAWECPDTCQLSCIMPVSHIIPADYRHWSHASRTVDLIHNTCHLCLLSRTDGIKAMSHGFSGGKQVIKSANIRNHSQICLF